MSNTLIVFENVPESTDFFLIPNDVIDDTLQKLINGATGKFINSDDDIEALDELYNRLYEGSHYGDDDEEIANLGDLAKYMQNSGTNKITAEITDVRLMGFYC